MAEPLYKIGPGDGEWLTIMQLLHKLGDWHNLPPGTGSPSMTISKDTREPAPAARPRDQIFLATPCPECTHSYNWHLGGEGCQVEGCLCDGFPR